MASGSKYETMANTIKEKVQILSSGVDGVVRQKEIEGEVKRIDQEIAQEVEEIQATPIDGELIKQQAEAALNNSKSEHAREAKMKIQEAESILTQVEEHLTRAKNNLELTKETSREGEITLNLQAQQEYERTVSSIGNVEQTIKLKVQKAKADGEKRKLRLNIELDSITAKNDAHKEKIECFEKLYDDLKEISLKLGDSGSK